MPRTEAGAMTVKPPAGGREGRIHHHRVVTLVGRKQIIKTLGIESRWQEFLQSEELSPSGVDFVCVHEGTGKASQGSYVASAGTGLKHRHTRPQGRGLDDYEGLSRRRAELLIVNLPLVSSRLPWQSGLLSQEPLDCRSRVAKISADSIQVNVEPCFRRIISLAGVTGCISEYLLSQITNSQIVKGRRRFRFQGNSETNGKLR